jgi:two-component system, cell cycle sensor histidine kinase and response regulator CckA
MDPSAAPTRPSVLVVEDDDVVRGATTRILSEAGYSVAQAANAAEALERCERLDTLDLLISDVVMPGPSGYELARRTQELCPEAAILLMSGYTPTAMARHGLDGEVFRLLAKPVGRRELLGAVCALVGPGTPGEEPQP